MTPTQRKTHVLLWLVLGPVALIGLALAVLWRPPVPVQPGVAPGAVPTTDTADDPSAQLPGAGAGAGANDE